MAYKKIRLLNVDVDDITMTELLDNFHSGIFLTLHVDMIMKLQKDGEFYSILPKFDLITCDSQILYFASKLLGIPLRERVSGSDYFPLFCDRHKDDIDVTVFLCGGQPGVAEIAMNNINERIGRRLVVGTYAPPFDFDTSVEEQETMIDKINDSGATVLLVGLGGGRQEKFMVANRNRFENVRLFLPLGGTIDYEAGTLKRPPKWITNIGLEWLYRLVKEPFSRWRRYLLHQPPVIFLLIKQKLGLYKNPFATLTSSSID